MAYSVAFDSPDGGQEEFFLCSVGAWTRFCGWVKSLRPAPGGLTTLVTLGVVKDTATLAAEMEDLANGGEVFDSLKDRIGVGSEDEVMVIVQDIE